MNAPLRTVVKWQNAIDEGGDGTLRPLMGRCPQFCRVFELSIAAQKKADTEIKLVTMTSQRTLPDMR
jgi:hypothetical protein